MRLLAVILALTAAIKPTLAISTLSSFSGYQPGVIFNIDQNRRLSPDVHGMSSPLQQERTLQLGKRTGNLQIEHMKIHQMVVPIRFAAHYLFHFYSRILRDCLTQWVHAQPVAMFSIILGPFEMTLRSTLGPVPWSLVSEVAANMLAATTSGFTGTYDMWYTDTQSTSVVAVVFRIRSDALMDLSVWLH